MARRPDNPRPGLLVIDKPQGLTSHDVVSRVRRLAHTRKVGHGGTLDPMATGVLVIGIGKATKLLTWVSGHSKEYRATIRFGVATNTDDAEGVATAAVGCASLSEEQLEAALAPLRGDIMQVPSTVSAIKVNGKRAYALARAGADVELAARPVRISRLEVLTPPRPAECILEESDADNAPDEQVPSGPVRVVDVDVVVEATRLAREKAPELAIEGPIQFDAAVDEAVASKKLPGSEVAGKATVFVFPSLEAGNIGYKAVQRSSGALAVGPVLQGLNKPVNDLSRGALVEDIVNTVALTAVQAQG